MDFHEYNLEACYLAKEINLIKTAEKLDKNLVGKRREFLTYLVGPKEFVFIFSFGAVVFVNMNEESQGAFRRSLSKFFIHPLKNSYHESYILREHEGKMIVGDEATDLPVVNVEEIGIVARVLAQSVSLEYIEEITKEAFSNVETANTALSEAGLFSQNTGSILRLVNQNNGIIQFIISKLSLLDKPEITWEHKQLEMLFSQLSDIFELRARFKNIEYKIGFTRTNSEFAFAVAQARRANFLEWMIIALFVLDIVLLFWLR